MSEVEEQREVTTCQTKWSKLEEPLRHGAIVRVSGLQQNVVTRRFSVEEKLHAISRRRATSEAE